MRARIGIVLLVFLAMTGCVATPRPHEQPPPEENAPETAPSVEPERSPEPPRAVPEVPPERVEQPEARPDAEVQAIPVAPPPEEAERETVERTIDAILAGMTIEEKIGQLFIPAIIFDENGQPAQAVTASVAGFLHALKPGGVLLFGRNIVTIEQTRDLIAGLQAESDIPLLIAVDQEGGLVSRLNDSDQMPATVIPAPSVVGRAGDPELAYELARVAGRELRALGFTMNLAPVADVMTNPDNPVIGSRAFGSDPAEVGRMVAATVRGLQDQNVSAVLKHFPGHGDTAEDTHRTMTMLPHSLDRLRAVEFVPFRSGIEAGADGVMIAHISLPLIRENDEPATFAADLQQDILRGELGFSGVIVTDSLTMGALVNRYPEREVTTRALVAGADLLLRPRDPLTAAEDVRRAMDEGQLTEVRIEESVRRILRLKFKRGLMSVPDDPASLLFVRPTTPFAEEIEIGTNAHRAVVQAIRAAANGR